jgi:hypothetical protein
MASRSGKRAVLPIVDRCFNISVVLGFGTVRERTMKIRELIHWTDNERAASLFRAPTHLGSRLE